MLIALFKSNQKIINILIIALALLMWLPTFWVENSVATSGFSLMDGLFQLNEIKWLAYLLGTLLVSTQAIYLNYIINEFKLVERNTHLISFIYVVLMSAKTSLLILNPVLIANTFLLLGLYQLFNVYNSKQAFALVFNTGLLLGIATLIYPPTAIVFPIIWIVTIYTKTPHWREFAISLLGFFVPFAFYLSYFYFTNQWNELLLQFSIQENIFKQHIEWSNYLASSYFVYLGLVVGFAFFMLLGYIGKLIVKIRKHYVVLFILFLLMTGTFLMTKDYLATYILITIPLSIIIANYFNEMTRKWLAEVVFLCFMITVVLGYFS